MFSSTNNCPAYKGIVKGKAVFLEEKICIPLTPELIDIKWYAMESEGAE